MKYNVVDETGWYLNISGTSPQRSNRGPGVLTTTNPFYFQGKWAERKEDRYFLHRRIRDRLPDAGCVVAISFPAVRCDSGTARDRP